MKNRIESIRVVREVDTDADLSHLGEYSRSPGGDYSIDREERGDMERGEYRYFNTSGNYKGEPQADIAKYTDQDYERAERYNRGDWCMTGVRAEARVYVNDTLQVIRSGGLWGIESDSEESYFAEIAKEELSQLADTLESLGFSARSISKAMPKTVEFA